MIPFAAEHIDLTGITPLLSRKSIEQLPRDLISAEMVRDVLMLTRDQLRNARGRKYGLSYYAMLGVQGRADRPSLKGTRPQYSVMQIATTLANLDGFPLMRAEGWLGHSHLAPIRQFVELVGLTFCEPSILRLVPLTGPHLAIARKPEELRAAETSALVLRAAAAREHVAHVLARSRAGVAAHALPYSVDPGPAVAA